MYYKDRIPQVVEDYSALRERVAASKTARQKRIANEQTNEGKTNTKRIVVIAGIIIIFVAFLVVCGLSSITSNAKFDRAFALPCIEVIIEEGDTIDGIAASHPVAGLSDHELGYVINEINPDITKPLQPGDFLLVPQDS